jgi:alkylation response protein AidB-like acyl-CoA dehydrogenase
MESQLRLSFTIEKLIKLAKSLKDAEGRSLIEDQSVAARLGRLRGQSAALKAMTYMGASRAIRTDMPGPEGTFIALQLAELKQTAYRLAMELLGPRGLERPEDLETEDDVHQYLYSYAATIGGGTSEIRRNIIGERILGLPR